MIEVSIIIINHNEPGLLKECVVSLVRETKEVSYEVIVIDNGSTVGNIEQSLSEFPSVKLFKTENNVGFAAANNLGLKHSVGRYLLFLNNDTLFTQNVIKKVIDFAEKLNNPFFVSCQLLNANRTKQETVTKFPSVWNGFTENFFLYKLFPKSRMFNKYYQNNIELTKPTEVDVIRGAFMFCSADAVRKLNGFDERFFFYSEETDLCYRFTKNGGRIFFMPDVSIIHYGGVTTDKNLWFKFRNQTIGKIQFYQKHFRGIRFAAALFFHFAGLLMRGILFTVSGFISFRKTLSVKGFYFFKQMTVYPKNSFKQDKS